MKFFESWFIFLHNIDYKTFGMIIDPEYPDGFYVEEYWELLKTDYLQFLAKVERNDAIYQRLLLLKNI